jgi:peptidyl-prolyl cis-trans isomerase A (cyclophilin A)
MFFVKRIYIAVSAVALCMAAALSGIASATVVQIETVSGSFEINLYDNATPETVANFLNYVQNGDYTDSIFHRSVGGFIIQGGGFRTDGNAQVTDIPANPAVTNEPVYSNVRGTIAMAKVGGNVNSATNQWFINIANNAADLDGQNGGFTVFGEVTSATMAVVDDIEALPTYAFAAPFGELPLRDYTADDFTNAVVVNNAHLIIVTAITVIDSAVDSAGVAGLNPTPTTNTGTGGGGVPDTGGGGGGSFGILALLGLLMAGRERFLRGAA